MLSAYRKSFITVSIAYLPILLYWCWKEFIEARPFWIYYDHIETLYYYTAMELFEGHVPHNVDNPGSLVQIIGAVLLKFLGTDPSNYVIFQRATHGLTLLISFIASVLMVRYVLPVAGYLIGIACVWLFFIFPVALMFLQVWGPEALYYPFGVLFLIFLFRLCQQPEALPNWKIGFTGVLLGVLLSIKFTFLAWVPALLLTLFVSAWSSHWSLAFIRPTIAVIGIIAGFLLITFPVRDSYPYMFGWLQQLAFNDGMYGRGQPNMPDLSQAWQHWRSFIMGSKVWLLLMCSMALVLVWRLPTFNQPQRRSLFLLATFLLTAVALSMLFIIRSYAQRYMLPVGLCGVLLGWAFFYYLGPRLSKQWQWAIAAAMLLVLIKSMNIDLQTHRLKTQEGLALHQTVTTKLDALASQYVIEQPVVIYGWRVPAPSFALRQQAQLEAHQRRVDQLYPYQGHYTAWVRGDAFRLPYQQTHWDFAVIRQDDLQRIKALQFIVLEQFENYMILAPQRAHQ